MAARYGAIAWSRLACSAAWLISHCDWVWAVSAILTVPPSSAAIFLARHWASCGPPV
jgi:hypothetical protein